MTINTTDTGVSNETFGIDDAADAFMSRWSDAEKPSEKPEEKKEVPAVKKDETAESEEETEGETEHELEEQSEEETEEESTEEADESEEIEEETEDDSETKEGNPKVLGDDDEVEVTVDKETKKVSVKELKRLFGQEAALTKKSQQVATQRKEVEAQGAKHAAVIDQLYQRAQAKWEPYSKVDMLLASKELDSESFAALRAEAQSAYEEFQFVSQEADRFMFEAQSRQQEQIKVQAQEAVKVLKEKIPNWSNEMYDKIRTYAVSQGFDADVVATITNPAAIEMMHKARLYDEGKNIKLKPKLKAPTKVITSSKSTASDMKPDNRKASMQKLRNSGSTDDAMEALMARWAE